MRTVPPAGRTRCGQALIEFLLMVPLLLLIIYLVATFGRGFRLKERAVVGSRHAAWHTAETGSVDDIARDFFYNDPTGGHGGRASPNDGKLDFENRIRPTGYMAAYWTYARPQLSGESRQHAAVDYVPPGSVYRYTLNRIGETTAREYQTWYWREHNFWRYFGDLIVVEPTARRNDIRQAFDQAAQQGLAAESDPVLLQALSADLNRHRSRMDSYYGGWISSWNRG